MDNFQVPMRGIDREQFPEGVAPNILCWLADSDTMKEINRVRMISPDRILFQPWSDERLRRSLRMYNEGKTPPPIDVSRYWLKDKAYYIVSDGMHRSAAAHLLGKRRIRARVYAEVWCNPDQFVLYDGCLWKKKGSILKMISQVNAKQAELLRDIVEVFNWIEL